MTSLLVAREVSVEYFNRRTEKRTLALDRISLDIEDGEFVSIVGASGCGKTTFLNAVDGLVPINAGAIEIDGVRVNKPGPDRAVVFQNASLLPWRTVLRNVSYGLELKGVSVQEACRRADDLIDLVQLGHFKQSLPYELSGGMQQRVNLARALACDPKILLMDEPFAALDAQTRELMQEELLRIWTESRKTAIFVTHQIDEALFLSDRVLVFSARPGRLRTVVEVDLPRPRSLSVKRTPHFMDLEQMIWEMIYEEAGAGQLIPEVT